jgi:hypothetical protein
VRPREDMGEGKVVSVIASGTVTPSGSVVATVVSSGTAIVPAPNQPSGMQTVVVPKLDILPDRFQRDFAALATLVDQAAAHTGASDKPGLYVEEVELHVDVTAEGGLRLLGSGVDPSAAAGMRILFKRGKPTGS